MNNEYAKRLIQGGLIGILIAWGISQGTDIAIGVILVLCATLAGTRRFTRTE
jgi:hypothetical protein